MKILPGGLEVFECADWGARPPTHASDDTVPTAMVVHHMATANTPLIPDHDAAIEAAFELARMVQGWHMDDNGWSDTGQHFSVTRNGIVLEGRHGSLAALLAGHCIRGAHAADGGIDFNDSWGVEHEGTYMTEQPPDVQWDASVKLYAAIGYLCKLDTATILGHRDTGIQTSCCGDAFEALLPRFREKAHDAKVILIG